MPYYTLKQLGKRAKQLREDAGDSLRDACDKINDLRGPDEGTADYSNLRKAEKGDSKYRGLLQDELRVYAERSFKDDPYYYVPIEMDV